MPKSTFPRDRFDELADESGRVGAHRSENPRMRGGAVLLWAIIATVVLVAVGIFGTLVVSGRITLFPTPEPTASAAPVVTPVIDPSVTVVVLNASGQDGLGTGVRDTLVAAGWAAESVLSGGASSLFETTTVYYSLPEEEGVAAGVAEAIGGAEVAQSNAYDEYPVEDDAGTAVNEAEARRVVVVIGTDRAGATPAA